MCLLLFAIRPDPRFALVVAANRDEMYTRPAAPLGFWEQSPGLLAGRDLEAGGTWLGLTRGGRFAALTNFRERSRDSREAPSRGTLVAEFLLGREEAASFLDRLRAEGRRFRGFSMVFGTVDRLFYFSNREQRSGPLAPGIYGLSNGPLDSPWPKVSRGKERLRAALAGPSSQLRAGLFTLLSDRSAAPDSELPDTGVGMEWERLLSPCFVVTPVHGTRCSTVLIITPKGEAYVEERSFGSGGVPGTVEQFEIKLTVPESVQGSA
jgi:uncharacterized protein with NRDE domain